MSRLKKIANDPYISVKVQEMVSRPEQNKNEDKSEAFLLAKEIIAELPISPSNSITYLLADAISAGILDASDKEKDFKLLLEEAQGFLRDKGILVSTPTKTAAQNNLYADKFTDTLYTNDYLDMNKDVNKQNGVTPNNIPNEKEKYISDSYAIAKDLIFSLPIVPRYDLMSQLAQDIERGDFDDISDQAGAKANWDAWLARARQILRARNIILSSNTSRLKRIANQ